MAECPLLAQSRRHTIEEMRPRCPLLGVKRARTMGLEIQVLNADTADEIDGAFEKSARERFDALFMAATPFLSIHLVQMAQLAAFYRLPTAHYERAFTEAGGLMSYGSDIPEAFRQAGVYGGRI